MPYSSLSSLRMIVIRCSMCVVCFFLWITVKAETGQLRSSYDMYVAEPRITNEMERKAWALYREYISIANHKTDQASPDLRKITDEWNKLFKDHYGPLSDALEKIKVSYIDMNEKRIPRTTLYREMDRMEYRLRTYSFGMKSETTQSSDPSASAIVITPESEKALLDVPAIQSMQDAEKLKLAESEEQEEALLSGDSFFLFEYRDPPAVLKAGKEVNAAIMNPEKAPAASDTAQMPALPDVPDDAIIEMKSELSQTITDLTGTAYDGAVSAAMEAVRLIYGPMTDEEETRFQDKWAPLFDFPSREVVEYFNSLNPLLVEYLSVMTELRVNLADLENVKYEAEMAAAYEDEDNARLQMALMGIIVEHLQAGSKRMNSLAAAVIALGDPPDPFAARRRARKTFEDEIESLAELLAPTNLPGGYWVLWRYDLENRERPGQDGGYVFSSIGETNLSLTLPGDYEWRWQAHWTRPPDKIQPGEFIQATNTVFRTGGNYRHSPWHRPMNFQVPWDVKNGKFVRATDQSHYSAWDQAAWSPEKIEWGCRAVAEMVESADSNAWPAVEVTMKILVHYNSACKVLAGEELARDEAARTITAASSIDESTYHPVREEEADWLFVRRYLYVYQPTGISIEVMGGMSGGEVLEWERAEKERSEEAAKVIAKRDEAKQELEYHENNIRWAEKEIDVIQRQMRDVDDDNARMELQMSLIRMRAYTQRERDMITTRRTGQYVRTRTLYDEVISAQMLAQSRKQAAEIAHIRKCHEGIQHMLRLIPENERASLDEWARNQTRDRYADVDHLVAIGRVLNKRIEGHYQGKAAESELEAARYELAIDICRNYMTAAQLSMYATPFVAGGPALALAYGVTSGGIQGYQTGGPIGEEYAGTVWGTAAGAAYVAANYYSATVNYACAFYEGYTSVDEKGEHGGMEAGVKNVAVRFIQRKVVSAATKRVMAYQQTAHAAKAKANLAAFRDAQRRVEWRNQKQAGAFMAQEHVRRYNEYKTLKASGASPVKIAAAEQKLMQQTAAIKHAPHAKGYLKYNATPREKRAYNACDRLHTARITAKFKEDLARKGFDVDKLDIRAVRNFRNTSASMDLDLAVETTLPSGRYAWRDPTQPAAGAKPGAGLSPHIAAQKMQTSFDSVYKTETGYSARGSWQKVTYRNHPEAYKDLTWLKVDQLIKSGVDPFTSEMISYAPGAAKITAFKAHDMDNTAMTRDNRNWEIMRGTAKDMENKLMPLVETKMKQTTDAGSREQIGKTYNFLKTLKANMESFYEDPVSAEHELMRLTGKSPVEAVNAIADAMAMIGVFK